MTLGPPWAGDVQFMALLPACAPSSVYSYQMNASWRNYFCKSVKHLKDSHSNKKRGREGGRDGEIEREKDWGSRGVLNLYHHKLRFLLLLPGIVFGDNVSPPENECIKTIFRKCQWYRGGCDGG